MSWWSEKVTDPFTETAKDVIGEEAYDVASDVLVYGSALPTGGLTLLGTREADDLLADIDPGNLLDPYREAGDAAERLALEAADFETLSTAESVRIMEEENARTLSTARARAGASGISGASTEMYISALEETGVQDVAWLKAVGASKYDSRITEGELAQSQAEAQKWGAGASMFSTTLGVTGLFV